MRSDSKEDIISISNKVPVAVFVGGTSGIGQGMAEVFAEQTEGMSHIILVGRNRAAAEQILRDLRKPADTKIEYKREFIQCDATLMRNVDNATREVLRYHSKINYLLLSCGFSTLSGRDETKEGIDKKLALHYYARWKFIVDLLPALEKAHNDGEDAKVMSVMAAGHGGPIDVNDLALTINYSPRSSGLAAPTYTDLMMESFASRSPSLTFIHSFPGLVRTNIMSSSPSLVIRAFSPVLFSPMSPLGLILRPFSTSHTEAGMYMWKALRETTSVRPGVWRTGSAGEDLGQRRYYGDAQQREALWAHTTAEVKRALQSNVD